MKLLNPKAQREARGYSSAQETAVLEAVGALQAEDGEHVSLEAICETVCRKQPVTLGQVHQILLDAGHTVLP